ncbi:hypothetical protein IFR05_010518 [Cadophora sp. M221]|nr:hypothetical protein IFR05_010518 [Cadophora sp. M221]
MRLATRLPVLALLFIPLRVVVAVDTLIIPTDSRHIGDNQLQVITRTRILVDTQYLTNDPSSYAGHVGTNTELLTEENHSLKWIGPNTQYLTEVVATTTVSGTPVTATRAIKVSLVGPVATDGAPITDFDIVISPSFLGELNGLRGEFCTFVRKRSGACGIEFGRKVLTAYEAHAAAAGAAAAGTGAAGGIFAAVIQKMVEAGQEIPHKVHISHEDYVKATPTGSVVTVITITRTTLTSGQTATPTTLLIPALSSSSSSSTTGGTGPNGPNSGSAQDPEATLYPSCWRYTGPDIQHSADDTYEYAFDDDIDPLNLHGIGIAGRIMYDSSEISTPISKRDKAPINRLGNCKEVLEPQIIPARTWTRPQQVMNQYHGIPPEQWWYIPTMGGYDKDAGLCKIQTLQHVGRRDPTSNGVGTAQWPEGYHPSRANFKRLTLDHVYEVSILKEFFDSVFLTPFDSRCQSFITLFHQPNTNPDMRAPDGRVITRLQSLWDQGANKQNKAFLGMDEEVNSIKGKLFNRNLAGIQKVLHPEDSPQWLDKNLNLWNAMGMSWSVLHFPIAAEQFRKVNNAIYRGFLAFDLIQSCNPDDAPGILPRIWAEVYKEHIPIFLRQQQASVIQHVASVTSAITAVPSATENPDHSKTMEGFAFDELAAVFNDDFWNLDIVTMLQLDWSGAALDIRDETYVCPILPTSTSSTTVATSTPTNGISCNCDENGCTASSLPCCGNGSCGSEKPTSTNPAIAASLLLDPSPTVQCLPFNTAEPPLRDMAELKLHVTDFCDRDLVLSRTPGTHFQRWQEQYGEATHTIFAAEWVIFGYGTYRTDENARGNCQGPDFNLKDFQSGCHAVFDQMLDSNQCSNKGTRIVTWKCVHWIVDLGNGLG